MTQITFGDGTYEVTLTPVATGYTVLARLQGRIVAAYSSSGRQADRPTRR